MKAKRKSILINYLKNRFIIDILIFVGLYLKYTHSGNIAQILYLLAYVRLADIFKTLEDYLVLEDLTQRIL